MIFEKVLQHNFSHGTGYRIPAGEYWIGDLSSVLTDSWSNFLSVRQDYDSSSYGGKHEGMFAAAFATFYGDGIFQDNQNHEYVIDSGMIGIIDNNLFEDEPENGVYFTFDEEFEFSINNEGIIYIDNNVFVDSNSPVI